MARTIFEKLEKGIGREIDNMPYGLTKRQMRRLVDRALEKVIRKVGRECGIPNADIEETKKVFWDCDMSFPNFDDECYIKVMEGMKGGKTSRMGTYEYIEKPKGRLKGFTNDILFEGKWGATHDQETKIMLGGYSEDGKHFRPDFRITEIDEDDMPNAIAVCSQLYEIKGKIDTTFDELINMYSECKAV